MKKYTHFVIYLLKLKVEQFESEVRESIFDT